MVKILKHGLIGLFGVQLLLSMPNTAYAQASIATDSNAATETGTELEYIRMLEELAEEYKEIAGEKEHFTDTRKEVMVYIRSRQYKSSAWNICAGAENSNFTKYVSDNNKNLEQLRTLGAFNTPYTFEKSKFVHFIGAMNMAYKGYWELGSWAGDLVQMTKNLKDKQPMDDDVEKTARELLCGKSQFTKEEMIADIDAINIAAMLENEEIPVSQVIDEYYQTLMDKEDDERYRMFIKNQFGLDVISKEKLVTETSEIMKEDVFINILFGNYNISIDDKYDLVFVDAAIGAFTDYVLEQCPEDMVVDDSFFPPEDENNEQKPGSGSSDNTGSSGGGSGGGNGHNRTNISDSTAGLGMPVSMIGSWRMDGTGWYFVDESGIFPKESWQYLEYEGKKNWYYFNVQGYMATGWQFVDEKWYYLNASGEMLTVWQLLNGCWYYMELSGAMIKDDITPDGYKVNTSGKLIS